MSRYESILVSSEELSSLDELSLDDELSLSLDELSLDELCEDSSGLFGVHAQRARQATKSSINILLISSPYLHFPQSEHPEHIILLPQVSQFLRN
jgi:hypothetical protein